MENEQTYLDPNLSKSEQFLQFFDLLEEWEDFVETMRAPFTEKELLGDDEWVEGEDDDLYTLPEFPNDTRTEREKKQDAAYERRRRFYEKLKKKVIEDYEMYKQFMTSLIAKITKILEFIRKVTDISRYIASIQNYLMYEIENNPYYREYKCRILVLQLEIKKLMIKMKKWLSKVKIKLMELFVDGKCCDALEAIYGAYIITVKVLAEVVLQILEVFKMILKFIPPFLTVGPEGMSFFITPKTMIETATMPIMNFNKSIGDWLNDAINQAISELLNTPTMTNIARKQAFAAAAVAQAQANMSVSMGMAVPMPQLPDVEGMIYKAIDILISLLPFPQPLPKYEKLNMFTNLGFSIWLVTGWCRAGNVAFGLPMQLPGAKAVPAEGAIM
jgi:hypothetical protein